MNDLQTQLQAAKARLNAAAAACLSGAPGAALEADEAMAETKLARGKELVDPAKCCGQMALIDVRTRFKSLPASPELHSL